MPENRKLELKLYIDVSETNSRFGSPVRALYNLQKKIHTTELDSNKYAVAVSGDPENPHLVYFFAPGSKQVWLNGLDSKESVSECVVLFDTNEAAEAHINRIGYFSTFTEFQLYTSRFKSGIGLELILLKTFKIKNINNITESGYEQFAAGK